MGYFWLKKKVNAPPPPHYDTPALLTRVRNILRSPHLALGAEAKDMVLKLNQEASRAIGTTPPKWGEGPWHLLSSKGPRITYRPNHFATTQAILRCQASFLAN